MKIMKRGLEGALQLLARMLADTCGVEVVLGAYDTASTNGQKVYIPFLPANDDRAKIFAFGYIPHESAHIKYTDFSFFNCHGMLHSLTNILEDIRVDTLQMLKLPGYRMRMVDLDDLFIEEGKYSQPTPELDAGILVQMYMLYELRFSVLGVKSLDMMAQNARKALSSKFPPAAMVRLDALMNEVRVARSTKEVANLATEILQMIQDEIDKAKKQQAERQQQQSQQSGDASQSNDGGGAQGQQQDPAAGSDDNKGSSPGKGGKKKSGKKGSSQGGAEDPTASSQAADSQGSSEPDITDSQLQALEESLGCQAVAQTPHDMVKEELAKAGQEAKLKGTAIKEVSLGRMAGGSPPELMLSETRKETLALRRRIESLLQAQSMVKPHASSSARRLNTSRLYRPALGNPRVFTKYVEGYKPNTAVQILIDNSSSMTALIQLAARAAASVGLSLEGFQRLSVATAVFPAGKTTASVISDFGESVRGRAGVIGNLTASGGTPMAEGMLAVAPALIQRKESRKILLVVTDGQPDNTESARSVIEALKGHGVECMAVGIQMDPSGVFDTSCTIQGAHELPGALFKMLQDALFDQGLLAA